MESKPNRRNNAVFSNFSGMVRENEAKLRLLLRGEDTTDVQQ